MPYDLSKYLVIAITSRALFDLSFENEIFEKEEYLQYSSYQIEHENEALKPGAGFPLAQALLRLNDIVPNKRKTEVIIVSKNHADTSLRIFNSIEHYNLDIKRAVLTGGAPLTPYLKALNKGRFVFIGI